MKEGRKNIQSASEFLIDQDVMGVSTNHIPAENVVASQIETQPITTNHILPTLKRTFKADQLQPNSKLHHVFGTHAFSFVTNFKKMLSLFM
jgi:hypothetical protein